MNSFRKIMVVAAMLVGMMTVTAMAQDSCQPLLQDLVAHASTPAGNGENYVTYKLVGNREGSDWAQYADGELHYRPGRFLGYFYRFPTFGGDSTEYFSDRLWTKPGAPGSLFGSGPYPFNPDATDKLRIGFNIMGWSGNYADLTYTLLSWGNASQTVSPKCQGGYMYAFLGDQMIVLTFKKVTIHYPN